MSRSKRKTPKLGITTAESEKADKVAAHRRTRHAAKIAVKVSAHKDDYCVVAGDEHPAPASGSLRKMASAGSGWASLRDAVDALHRGG